MNLQLIYDGKALENHEINPKDLSVALLGIDALLNEANNTLNKGKAKIQVKVKASFETGCFKINFSVVQDLLDKAKDIFLSQDAQAVVNANAILATVIFSAGGVISLLKFLKGCKPEKIIETADGSFTIHKDSKQFNAEKQALELYGNYKFRQALEQIVSPLNKTGIDDCAFKIEGKKDNYCQIKDSESEYFKCPEPTETKLGDPVVFETNINIISLSFKENNKWYVNDGQSSFYVMVEDGIFLQKIDDNLEEFGKGDILKVKLRREQFYVEDTEKLKTENFIEEVINHSKPPKQPHLI